MPEDHFTFVHVRDMLRKMMDDCDFHIQCGSGLARYEKAFLEDIIIKLGRLEYKVTGK